MCELLHDHLAESVRQRHLRRRRHQSVRPVDEPRRRHGRERGAVHHHAAVASVRMPRDGRELSRDGGRIRAARLSMAEERDQHRGRDGRDVFDRVADRRRRRDLLMRRDERLRIGDEQRRGAHHQQRARDHRPAGQRRRSARAPPRPSRSRRPAPRRSPTSGGRTGTTSAARPPRPTRSPSTVAAATPRPTRAS